MQDERADGFQVSVCLCLGMFRSRFTGWEGDESDDKVEVKQNREGCLSELKCVYRVVTAVCVSASVLRLNKQQETEEVTDMWHIYNE